MGSHEKKIEAVDVEDINRGYEKNEIKVGGIIVTTVLLVVTCIAAFWLMWILRNQLDEVWAEKDNATANPMSLKPEEKLPPEPRLQSAPGFGVDGPNGRINLELTEPKAEWQALSKIWAAEAINGQKVIENGKEVVVTLPIAEAKTQLLQQGVKSVAPEEGLKNVQEVSDFYSSASAGRMASEVRR